MSTKTITGTTKAWLTEHADPSALFGDDHDRAVRSLQFAAHDMNGAGWTLVGEAQITVTVPDEKTLVENKVDALRAEKKRVLAEAQNTATELERKIQKLLAISYTPGAA